MTLEFPVIHELQRALIERFFQYEYGNLLYRALHFKHATTISPYTSQRL
jgi:UDP-galactopyranose mutase